jgi:hypothetical protein
MAGIGEDNHRKAAQGRNEATPLQKPDPLMWSTGIALDKVGQNQYH